MRRVGTYPRRASRRSSLRAGWRALALIALIPSLIIGSFGGTSFFAHAHHGHGVHWHAAPTPAMASGLAARHVTQHETGRIDRACPDNDHVGSVGRDDSWSADPPPAAPPDGILITIPDHELLNGRAVELPVELSATVAWAIPDTAMPAPSLGPIPPRTRPHQASRPPVLIRRTLDRLLRTSLALII